MPYLDYLLFRPPTKDKEDSDYLALVRGENDDAVPVSASGSGATGMLAIEDAITNFNAKVKK